MGAIEQVEELRQQAIQLLLAEQELIAEKLLQLGYDQDNSQAGKRRGRRPKVATEPDVKVNDAPPPAKLDESSRSSGSLVQTVIDLA
jgi:hypothetical protein